MTGKKGKKVGEINPPDTTMIKVTRKTRMKIKVLAAKKGVSMIQYLDDLFTPPEDEE